MHCCIRESVSQGNCGSSYTLNLCISCFHSSSNLSLYFRLSKCKKILIISKKYNSKTFSNHDILNLIPRELASINWEYHVVPQVLSCYINICSVHLIVCEVCYCPRVWSLQRHTRAFIRLSGLGVYFYHCGGCRNWISSELLSFVDVSISITYHNYKPKLRFAKLVKKGVRNNYKRVHCLYFHINSISNMQ